MDTFFLEILSPERTFYEGECLSLSVPITDGMLGIMAHHTPLTAAIEDGEISFTKPDGEKVFCVVQRGMVDFNDNEAKLLCESVLYRDEIDEAKELEAVEEARLELKKQQGEKDYKLWQLSLNKSINRLKVKTKNKDINL